MSSEPFCAAELRRALEEQAFAIKDFTLTPSPSEEGRATVVLLEGNTIEIQLTIQGYTVIFLPCAISETLLTAILS